MFVCALDLHNRTLYLILKDITRAWIPSASATIWKGHFVLQSTLVTIKGIYLYLGKTVDWRQFSLTDSRMYVSKIM